jgi:type VI secretion system VasD/TssJ family lipoprotein
MSLCYVLLFCCSCSFFAKKAPEVVEQGLTDLANQNPYTSYARKLTAAEMSSGTVNITAPNVDIAKVDSTKIAYRKNELTLQITADSQLNKFQNNAHALYMCIYQLKDPNAFNQQVEEKDGISKLLECTRFDSSVANSKRIVVQPGQQISDVRDRAEGARFLGVATGYYGAEKVRATQLIPMPVVQVGVSGFKVSIDLGPNEIDNVTVK